jgi:hypothetical protein
MQDSPFAPTPRTLRQFGGLWIVFFGAMATWQGLHHSRSGIAIALGIVALTIGPLGVVAPHVIRPVFVGWMFAVYPVGWLVSRFMLGVLFYGLFTPIGIISRAIGRDELRLRPHRASDTYWTTKPQAADRAQYLKQF